jgi:undecaprenyl-diphosphatase
MLDYIFSLDKTAFNWINGFAIKWPILDSVAVFFAKYFEYFLLAFLLIILAIKFRKNFGMVFRAVLSAVISRLFVTEIVRKIWFRPRPFVENHVNLLFPYNAQEASFPSGHASFYFALSTIIFIYNKKLGILFFVGSLLICLGRVFSGIHWPLDILTGIIIGVITALVINGIFEGLKKYFL